MTDRAAHIARFVDRSGWGMARRVPLAGDASNRRYERLTDGASGQSAVLMDAPPERGEDIRPFVRIAQFLTDRGFSAPQIYAQDPAQGLLLLEDLGDALFARVLRAQAAVESTLYETAVDALIALHQHPPPDDLPAYTPDLMAEKAALAGEWYVGGGDETCNVDPAQQAAEAIASTIRPLLQDHAAEASVLVQRDYHAENLIWLSERDGTARVGLLDFQDALAGHPAYDLVSLLEDARRDVRPSIQTEMLARYVARAGVDADAFRRSYALLGAQRNLRIIGVFARLSLHFGKPHYVDLIPTVWGHLQHDLAHPDLAALAGCVARWIPAPDAARLNRLKDRCATIPTV